MLTAEQMHDAICQATRVFGNYKRKDMVYGTDLPPVRFWTEAADARGHRRRRGQVASCAPSARPTASSSTASRGGSILQAMMLMNSPFVNQRVRAEERQPGRATGEVGEVERARSSTSCTWRRSRARRCAEEKELAVSWLETDRKQGAEDLQWSLLNKLDFVFNY